MSVVLYANNVLCTMSEKKDRYLVFYNLKKTEPLFIIFGMQCLDNTSFQNIYNFASNLQITDYLTLQFS